MRTIFAFLCLCGVASGETLLTSVSGTLARILEGSSTDISTFYGHVEPITASIRFSTDPIADPPGIIERRLVTSDASNEFGTILFDNRGAQRLELGINRTPYRYRAYIPVEMLWQDGTHAFSSGGPNPIELTIDSQIAMPEGGFPEPNDYLVTAAELTIESVERSFVGPPDMGLDRFDVTFKLDFLGGIYPRGDFNGNGVVENGDLTMMLNHWGESGVIPDGWNPYRLPGFAVDNGELSALLNSWGQAPVLVGASVPEPTAVALVAFACLMGLGVRKIH